MPEPPNVCLTLSNQPENVLLVRETLERARQTVGVDGVELNDIRTAVTEACNNVVLHAYEGREGPLLLEVYLADAASKWSCATTGRGSSLVSGPIPRRRSGSGSRSSRRSPRVSSSKRSRAAEPRFAWSSPPRAP